MKTTHTEKCFIHFKTDVFQSTESQEGNINVCVTFLLEFLYAFLPF